MKVCHMTSAHPQEDIRIFYKECESLVRVGHEVYQVAPGSTYEKNGIHQIGVKTNAHSRIQRILLTSHRVYKTALDLNADVYHFHDPELLLYGRKLKKHGKIVIFDSHEDIPKQIQDKPWIPFPFRKAISFLYKLLETNVVKRIDAVIVATPHIASKFNGRAKRVVTINNYPKAGDIIYHDIPFNNKEALVCYAGGISENRGESIMLDAMKSVEAKLIIAGDHEKEEKGNVKYVGRLDRQQINELYSKSVVGLCLLKPINNYYYSQPIKMYEYMAAGIPFVCSDFPSWKAVVDESGAGIYVNTDDKKSIVEAITFFLKNRDAAQSMGEKGHIFVNENCSWNKEEIALFELYRELEKSVISS